MVLAIGSFTIAGCSKSENIGGGSSPITMPLTLMISPSANLTITQGSTVTFSWTTNASLVKVDGMEFLNSYTSAPLQTNKDFTVTAYGSNSTAGQTKTVIVHVTVTPASPPNPIVTALTSGLWKIFSKEGRLTGDWFPYTLNPCELDDTHQFNLDGSITSLDNSVQCSPVPYPPGSWSLPYPDSLKWNSVNRGIVKATIDTLRLHMKVICVGGGCPTNGLADVRVTYIK